MRLLIADDHTLVRAGMRRLIEGFEGMVVVGEASDGEEALELAALHRPDIVLLDLSMPGRNGLEVTASLQRDWPGIRVVIISMHTDLARVRQALDAGASGFVVKDAAVAELELAVRAAAAGRTFLSPQISAQMVDSLLRKDGPRGIDALSPRQREILERLGRGQGNREIAAALGIGVKTVETHRARMMETLGCSKAPELLRLAMRHVDGGF